MKYSPKNNITTTIFPDQNGREVIKYPLKDLYAVEIGNQNEVMEVAICQKEYDDKNNINYHDLLTKNNYQTTGNKNDIIALTIYPITSLLEENIRNIILYNGYISSSDLVEIYNDLNEDKEYQSHPWKKDNKQYEAPIFAQTYNWNYPIFEENEEQLTQVLISLKLNNKPNIIIGKKGIGKTTFITKLLYYFSYQENNLDLDGYFIMNYIDMLKDTKTTKHEKNRIKKTIEFLKDINVKCLLIDNVNLNNKFFLETLCTLADKENIKLVLVSSNENDLNINKDLYNVIEIRELQDETKRKIFSSYFNTIRKKINITCSEDEIIDILLECDRDDNMNKTNYDSNPKLGINIIKSAYTIASTNANRKNKVLTKEHFIEALDQDNINMDQNLKEQIKEKINKTKEKINKTKEKTKKKSLFRI